MNAVYHPEESEEFTESANYYEGRRSGLGERFLDNVTASLETISNFPLAGKLDQVGYRTFRVKGFPFNIFYKPFPDYIFIVAVAHQRRRYGFWLERL